MKTIYSRLPTKKTPIALDILRRLAKPSEEFYRDRYPRTFRKAEYDMADHFECMTPPQVWYIRRSGELGYRRHLLAKSPTALGWEYGEFPEGGERLTALDFLEDWEIKIMDRFSQIIEAEWQKVQGAAA